jgi:hypothetical protein
LAEVVFEFGKERLALHRVGGICLHQPAHNIGHRFMIMV